MVSNNFIKTSILLGFLILFFAESTYSQACGYIFAKFQILNDKGDFVDDATLQLFHRGGNESILYRDSELSFSKTEHAFKLHHGMCGDHYGTRLIVSHPAYEKYESRIDLPLNSLKTEHVFTIRLQKKIIRPEVKQDTSVLTGTIYDVQGSVVDGAKIIAISSEGKRFETVSNDEGVYTLHLPFNKYPASGTFKEAQYDVIVESWKGFQRSETKGFVFIPSQFGKMYFDIALRIVPNPEPCGVSGADCLTSEPIETVKSTVPLVKISPRPKIERVKTK